MRLIECPWCGQQVRLHNDICPECKHEVLPDHLTQLTGDSDQEYSSGEVDVEDDIEFVIANRYHCSKCGHKECAVKEVAMTGAGLSKLLDIQHNHYLFVSCTNCGSVEIYDPDVLRAKKTGAAGTVLDLFFG